MADYDKGPSENEPEAGRAFSFRCAELAKQTKTLWREHLGFVRNREKGDLVLGGQFKSGHLESDQNQLTEAARNCQKLYPNLGTPQAR